MWSFGLASRQASCSPESCCRLWSAYGIPTEGLSRAGGPSPMKPPTRFRLFMVCPLRIGRHSPRVRNHESARRYIHRQHQGEQGARGNPPGPPSPVLASRSGPRAVTPPASTSPPTAGAAPAFAPRPSSPLAASSEGSPQLKRSLLKPPLDEIHIVCIIIW